MPISSDVAAYISATQTDEMSDLARAGYVKPVRQSGEYRLTLKGACHVVWKTRPPFKSFVARAQIRKTRQLLAEVGVV